MDLICFTSGRQSIEVPTEELGLPASVCRVERVISRGDFSQCLLAVTSPPTNPISFRAGVGCTDLGTQRDVVVRQRT